MKRLFLEALGIPPILMDSGNNANIRPNHRLYYLETILPITNKIKYAFERYFGFKLDENVAGIPALQPELRDQASYYATLVNTGIMTPNEAREALRLEEMTGFDQPRVPANIAGSAVKPRRRRQTSRGRAKRGRIIMTKDMMVKALSDFIASKGVETMDLAKYKSFGNDVPVKDYYA